ncbi:WD40 repeat-like protein [Exidia glandulosa HHB12029]|uniref:WD40 repeat-like protein n=1 Tax=Exidia glandulosa HHB12029 TaxID=1314781 RepID=A0A165JWQ8_EXIGL|nr:WD40 repeat-like protein [Exidia glandulosa HHB12029]
MSAPTDFAPEVSDADSIAPCASHHTPSFFDSLSSLLSRGKTNATSSSDTSQPAAKAKTGSSNVDALPVPSRSPCSCESTGRNLVICIDGTSNQFSKKNTNVVELYSRLVKDPDHQVTFYNSGIGTYAKPSWTSLNYLKQILENKVDLAIAWNFEKILLGAYLWLAENYKTGDRIYLFGFSRGAYQVRVLSAMLDAVGLIHKGNQGQIPFAYQLYAEMNPGVDTVKMKEHFKNTFSRPVRVHFVGVWDTVSSVGVVRDKTLPGTTNGMQHVCYFRHALALHERRVKFLPEYVNGGRGPDLESEKTRPDVEQTPHAKEVWFAGCHSDIGGGAVDNEESNKFGPALRWMTYEATRFGLLLGKLPKEWEEVPKISESLSSGWWPFEFIPFTQPSYEKDAGTTRWFHLGRGRVIKANQKVHVSARACTDKGRALVADNLSWDALVEDRSLERDPNTAAKPIMEPQKDAAPALEDEDIQVLSVLTTTVYGQQALRDIVYSLDSITKAADRLLDILATRAAEVAKGTTESSQVALTTTRTLFKALRAMDAKFLPPRLQPIAANIHKQDQDLAEDLMVKLGSPALRPPFKGHDGSVACAAFISNGRVISSSRDRTVRIWDPETGEDNVVPVSHDSTVTCLAVHGWRVASCSLDGTLCVWNMETGKVEVDHMQAHAGLGVQSIIFSHDGNYIATAGNDDCAAVWSLDGALERRLQGHGDTVLCVAFSQSGGLVVSGSQDLDARVWSVKSGKCVHTLDGHTGWVTAVCFDRSDKRIFSSSWDDTLRIWDPTTGEQIGKHEAESGLLTLALSNKGERFVTGSRKGKIELWDAVTGNALPAYFPDHTNRVWCVAFSSDDRKIVSASEDTTVGLWDATDEWKKYSFP